MRKTFCFLLIFVFLLSGCVYAGDKEAILDKKADEFLQDISKDNAFKVWKDEKIGTKRKLYNSKGEISAYLYTVEHDKNIIGYMLLDPDKEVIREFALGQSPYDDYLSMYMKKKNDKFKDKNVTLIYDGPSRYGVAIENNNAKEAIPFLIDTSVEINIDSLYYVDKLKKEKKIKDDQSEDTIIQPMNTFVSKNISLSAITVTKACGPAAGTTMVLYWDGHGYPNLKQSYQSNSDIENELFERMGTFYSGTSDCGVDQWATFPSDYENGLEEYFDARYPYQIEVKKSAYYDYDDVKTEIDNNRPLTLLYADHPTYGYHYVTIKGYRYSVDYANQQYYIIRDGWTSSDVYRNYITDSANFWYTYKIYD